MWRPYGREIFDDDLTADPEEETSGALPQGICIYKMYTKSHPFHITEFRNDKKETFHPLTFGRQSSLG